MNGITGRRNLVLAATLLALAACRAPGSDPPVVATHVAALVSDQNNAVGKTGFIWIAPMVSTTPTGFTALDQTGVANGLTIKVDRLFPDSTTTTKTSFTGAAITMVTTASSGGFPGVAGPFYGANWVAGATVAAGETYRVTVQALSGPVRTLGVADVQVVANATAAGQVDRTKFAPLVVGTTLPIVFRLESKDSDGDTLNDWRDNCPFTKNVNQADSNGDGLGNACQCLSMANGTPCSTGCKTGETCQSGVCANGAPVTNGTACTSGNLCKQSETCTNGTCGGGSNRTGSCSTGNPCRQSETCTSGACGGGNNRTGSCSTGNPCKQSETCTSGACGGGAAKPNNTPCSDGNLCTQNDTCQSGSCTGASPVVCATDACHNGGTCNPTSGTCPARRTDGTTCSDGNACTRSDGCLAGVCTGSNPLACVAADACHGVGACLPATGICSNPPLSGGTCGTPGFDYDGAGRLVHDRDTRLTYDAYDHLLDVRADGATSSKVAHTYGADGMRTSTTTAPGTGSAKPQYWFVQDYTEHDAVRDHYVRVGDRIVARVTFQPPTGGAAAGTTASRSSRRMESGDGGHRRPMVMATSLFASALAIALLRARRRISTPWLPGGAGLFSLVLVLTSCGLLGGSGNRSAALLWDRVGTIFLHQTLSPGPTLLTDGQGGLFEERRFEPFGHPIDAFGSGASASVDFTRDPQNILGKMTDSTTGWSYHAARWMAPQTGRWLSPDPLAKEPSKMFLATPWDLNPYQYVRQSPTLLWDPNGAFPVRPGTFGVFTRIAEVINPKLATHELISKVSLQSAFGDRALDEVVSGNTAEDAHQKTDPASQSRHGMRGATQDPMDAMNRNANRIEGRLENAINDILKGDYGAARREFGAATHNVQDNFTPAHRSDGVPNVWNGVSKGHLGDAISHGLDDLGQKIDQKPAIDAAEATRELLDELNQRVKIEGEARGISADEVSNRLNEFFDR